MFKLRRRAIRKLGTLEFTLPLPVSTITNQQVSDKAKVRETIFQLRAEVSYREIAKVVGLHLHAFGRLAKPLIRDERIATEI